MELTVHRRVARCDPAPAVPLARALVDLADYLILCRARTLGAALLTFDKRLARAQGATLL